jgi:hypothetical protein
MVKFTFVTSRDIFDYRFIINRSRKGGHMKGKSKALAGFMGFVVSAGLILFGALPGALAGDPEMFPCAADGQVEKDVGPGAELAELSCFFKRFEGQEALHVKVGVTNVSDQDQRFRVNLFFDNGKAVGGLIPRKTKKGLIKPGETKTFVYPVNGMTEKPASLTLKLSTIGN